MKKHVLSSLAIASLVSLGSFGSFALKTAAADNDELRYHYPDFEVCEVTAEQFACTNMIETDTSMPYRVPFYYATDELTNCCGPVAGSIIVGYYDRYYPDLIPNWTPYSTVSGNYKLADGTHVPAVMQELYVTMRTNVDDVGVSQADCRSGLQQYFTDRDMSLSYSSIESNSTFDFNLYQQAIAANKPVIMFCLDVTISILGFSSANQIASFSHHSISGGHIVVGYGYSTVNYYDGDDVIRTDTYLLVSSGRSTISLGHINIASTSWLVDGYAVTVS